MKSSRSPLLPFASVTVLLLLNYPWLSLFSSSHLIAGIPPLFLYLFCLWLAFILTIRVLLMPGEEKEPPLPADDLPDLPPGHPRREASSSPQHPAQHDA